MEKEKELRDENSPVAHIKPLKIQFSEENFAFLQGLDGDVGAHVNKAIEIYIRWLEDKGAGLTA